MTTTRLVTIWRRELVNINKTRDNHLSRLGQHFDHTLLVRDDQEIGEHIARYGTKVVRISTSKLGFIGFWIKAIVLIRRLHKAEKVDAIVLPIGEEPLAFVFRCFWRTRATAPKIILDLWDVPGLALEGTDRSAVKKILRSSYLSLLPRFLKSSDIVICGVVPDPLITLGVAEHRVIQTENGVNSDNFHTAVSSHAIWSRLPQPTTDSINLLYQGYIHEARGALSMITTLSKLRVRGHDTRLLMIGPSTSTEIARTERLAEKLGVAEHIVVQGEISSDQIPGVIAGAHICLCPLKDIEKFRWSYPVKIYEYMAMGKAVVASALPGTQRLIQHRAVAGCLYESTDEDGITTEVAWLLEHPDQQHKIAASGLQAVQSKSWDNNVRSIADSIKQKLL